ncbi:hypothetical protein [Nocardiopsis prasina]|uniref:hypothetical protein n=1 Tax=Nocardiopsis prasina TaxID=2015 RepID=UPI00034D3720|nr:hypothetical protein [Nocardiopsis prasina]
MTDFDTGTETGTNVDTGPDTDPRLRSVLDAPRGHRFSRPGETSARIRTHSRIRTHTLTHTLTGEPTTHPGSGDAAHPPGPDGWFGSETQQERERRLLPQMVGNPRVAHRLQYGQLPHWVIVARQHRERAAREAREAAETAAREPVPAPPEPPEPPEPARGRHRAPLRWSGWPALAVGATLLFGLQTGVAIGEGLVRAAGVLPASSVPPGCLPFP